MTNKKVLILGGTGMLGHMVARVFNEDARLEAYATTRSSEARKGNPALVAEVDAHDLASVERAIARHDPDALINCIGIVKQLRQASDAEESIHINALLPHQLARICTQRGVRLIHISTDCVFSGQRGNYSEGDIPDARDLYGLSKLLGEISSPPHLTLRTSIIGPEIGSRHGLLEWFLSQEGSVKGFARAVFSGLPTIELARLLKRLVLEHPNLTGLYHVSARPIDKDSLLHLIREAYGKTIEIVPDSALVIDRSLNSTRFRAAVPYRPPEWRELVLDMRTNDIRTR